MNKSNLYILIFLLSTILFSGCSSKKVYMKAIKPAKVNVLTHKRVVSVGKFKGDKNNLSATIESKLSSLKINNKNYFTVPNRSQLSKIIKEQKLQSSDLYDSTKSVKIGNLVGAQATIIGTVNSNANDGHYYETRKRCVSRYKNGKCAKIQKYRVKCDTATAGITANLNILDVQTGNSLFAKTITKNYNANSCKYSYNNQIASSAQALSSMSINIAQEFVSSLAPSYTYFSVNLIEDIDSIDINDKQEDAFENAIEYIQNNRINRAEEIFEELNNQLNETSYEVTYNLGLVKQSLGKYEDAKSLFIISDKIVGKPNKLIDSAIVDINRLILQRKKANKQLGD